MGHGSWELRFLRRLYSLIFAFCILHFAFCTSAGASPFAIAYSNYLPGQTQFSAGPYDPDGGLTYMKAEKTLGAPIGYDEFLVDTSSMVTLGDGGKITLAFDHDVIDDPANPGGYDFIVFSNAMFARINADGSIQRWQEPAFVEISQDGVTWYLIPPNILPSALRGSIDTGQSTTLLKNYAEYTPTLALPQDRFPTPLGVERTEEELYTVPDRQSVDGDPATLLVDPTSGGGDAFDIASAVRETSPGVPELDGEQHTIPAGIHSFRYVRLTDAIEGDRVITNPAPGVYYDLGEVSAEIDAVADVAPGVTVGQARRLPAASNYAVIWGAKVTAAFTGEFWIEQPDRSGGLRIASDASVAEGDTVMVTGHVTDLGSDKVVADSLVTKMCSGECPKPLGLSNRSTVVDLAEGLLVKVWGKRKEKGDGWFMVDDGSGSPVTVLYGSATDLPGPEEQTVVTGVLYRDAGVSIVRARRQEDIHRGF